MEERIIDIKQILTEIIKHLKAILLVALVCMGLAGIYSHMRSFGQVNPSNETHNDSNAEIKASIEEAIQRYEISLKRDKQYLDSSILMQIDPYHETYTKGEMEIQVKKSVDLNILMMLGRQYISAALSDDFMDDESKKFDIEATYLREVISISASDNTNDGVVSANTNDLISELMEEDDFDRYYLSIMIRGLDDDFTQEVYKDMVNFLTNKKVIDSKMSYVVSFTPSFTAERVNESLITQQNEVRTRIYEHSDKLLKIKANLDDLIINNEFSENEVASPRRVSKKYMVVGFFGGIILGILFFCLRYLLGDQFDSEDEFFSRVMMNDLGAGEGVSDKESDFFAMVVANICNYIENHQKVMFTGTIGFEEMENVKDKLLLQLNKKCPEIEFIFCNDILSDPISREKLQSVDSVVLVEKRKQSKYSKIEKEKKILDAFKKTILGVVIL